MVLGRFPARSSSASSLERFSAMQVSSMESKPTSAPYFSNMRGLLLRIAPM